MKNAIVIVVLLGVIGYLGYQASIGPCDRPIEYAVGTLSPQFGISEDSFRTKILSAESIWENALGKQLFTYNPEAKFTINLIYDERQREIDAKQKIEFGLSEAEDLFRREDVFLGNLKNQYEARVALHNKMVGDYEQALRKYESEVKFWNSRGGAPQSEFQKLEQDREYLNIEVQRINADVMVMNDLLLKLNNQLEIRNKVAERYNTLAKNYNDKYQGGLEFDQAEYTGKAINIYEFKNEKDLMIAIAHEFGHALGMDHVENPKSILYYLTGEQEMVPTIEDIAELKRVCGVN